MINEADAAGHKLRIAVLASGSGTTLQAVIDACADATIAAEVVLVIGNNSRSLAMQRAQDHGIETLHLSGVTHPQPAEHDRAMAAALSACAPDVVLLAGYMKKLGPHTLAAYRGRVINTHPSLLPRYGGQGMYGSHVHAQVIADGDRQTGVSIHLVDEGYDTGAVLAQREVPVMPGDDEDTLAMRVQAAEKPFLVETLGRIATGEIALGAVPSV